ncbi:MAG: hypothetical protein O2955_19800 [Planctomycetota bacterium]|nr:hypothetical protein [Planctomycetota bacterium]MDA1214759.1 hypothetical protein [Planctomycetota bacterium]
MSARTPFRKAPDGATHMANDDHARLSPLTGLGCEMAFECLGLPPPSYSRSPL